VPAKRCGRKTAGNEIMIVTICRLYTHIASAEAANFEFPLGVGSGSL